MTNIDLRHGDCLDVLAELDDASVDAVITDPPYGLANTDPAHVADTIVRWVNGDRDYLPGGAGFMGKAWDAFVPPVAVWDECLRVLKPGGHVLAFAGSRTVDLMTLGLRLAGFDIRDSIAWLYGSGFPKSLDVSKAIDKAAPRAGMFDAFAEHFRERRAASGLTQKDIAKHFPSKTGGLTGCVWNWENGANVPTPAQWAILAPMLDLSDEWLPLIERAEAEREVLRETTTNRDGGSWAELVGAGMFQTGERTIRDTAPATDAARTWQGWGTALKPAFEPIVVARKPLHGTVAANVLQHGTGALNIDACRVGAGQDYRDKCASVVGLGSNTNGDAYGSYDKPREDSAHAAGRWPANVVLDETQAAALDEQSGESDSYRPSPVKQSGYVGFGVGQVDGTPRQGEGIRHGDQGGASRFFYIAKADASERVRVNGTAHPTVKPLALMRWLVRLVTPPGGTVLEPFAGSGTTVEACILEGFSCVAIESEADYLPLIRQRIARRRDPVEAVKATGDDGGLFDLLEDGGAA